MKSSSTVTPFTVARRGGFDILGVSIGYAPMAMAIGAAIARRERTRKWYMIGMGLVLWPIWSAGTAIGIIAGAGLADDLPLGQVGILMIAGLLALNMQGRMQVVAAVSGGVAGLAALAVADDLAPLLAAAVAALVSTWMQGASADEVADLATDEMAT